MHDALQVAPSTVRPTAWRRAVLRLRAAPWTTLVEMACRAGYVARGAVYLSIGLCAWLAALRLTPHARGSIGALEAWAQWPFGVAMIGLAMVGLFAFMGWRVLQAVFDADRQGRSLKAWLSRGGQMVSGLVYGGLALSLFGLLETFDELREVDEQARTREMVASVLAWPGGGLAVMAAGLFVLAAGVGNMVQAMSPRFAQRLDCDGETRRQAGWIGRLGYLARGAAFLPAGAFVLQAGLHARANEATGLGGALDALESLPFGRPVMACVALGLMAFGVYALFEARFRPMRLSSTGSRPRSEP